MKSRYLLFFLILIYIISPCTATGDYKFRTMSPSGGFYYDGIKAIEQDKEGFIWTMMDYELYRFDGYHYKKYYPYFASMAPTKRWIFNNMASDLLGYLYVNTNNGVYRYDRNSDQFEKIYDPVSHIKVDKANNVWIRIKEKWSILNTQTGELNTPNYDGKAAGGVNTAFCIYNNDLYTFIGQKVYRFNYAKNEFVFCLTLPDSDGNIRFARAYMGKLWIFVNNSGLYKIDMSTFKIEDHYILTKKVISGLEQLMAFIYSILQTVSCHTINIPEQIHSVCRIIPFGKSVRTGRVMYGLVRIRELYAM